MVVTASSSRESLPLSGLSSNQAGQRVLRSRIRRQSSANVKDLDPDRFKTDKTKHYPIPSRHALFFSCSMYILCMMAICYQGACINISAPVIKRFIRFGRNVQNEDGELVFIRSLSMETTDVLFGLFIVLSTTAEVFGAFLSIPLCDRYGRKPICIILQPTVEIIGALTMFASYHVNSYFMLICGRAINGFGNGIGGTMVLLYVLECLPARWKNLSGTFNAVFSGIGYVVGAACSFEQVLGSKTLWPIMFLIPGISHAVLMLLGIFLFDESPKFLFNVRKEDDNAMRVAAKFHRKEDNLEMVLFSYREERVIEQSIGKLSAKSIWRRKELRMGLLISLACTCLMCLSGGGIINTYSSIILRKIFAGGASMNESSIPTLPTEANPNATSSNGQMDIKLVIDLAFLFMMILALVVRMLLAFVLIWKLGRRTLMLLGSFGTFFCLNTVFIVATLQDYSSTFVPAYGYLSLAAVLVFTVMYAIGPGSTGFFIVMEITPFKSRTTVLSLCTVNNSSLYVITSFIFPLCLNVIRSWSYLVIIIPGAIVLACVYKFLPEVKDKTLEDVLALWQKPDEMRKPHLDTIVGSTIQVKQQLSVLSIPALANNPSVVDAQQWLAAITDHADTLNATFNQEILDAITEETADEVEADHEVVNGHWKMEPNVEEPLLLDVDITDVISQKSPSD